MRICEIIALLIIIINSEAEKIFIGGYRWLT